MSTTSTLRGVLTDAAIAALRQRNAARMQREIERLGPRYLLAVRVTRLTARQCNYCNRRTT